jgi:hypothetical protein
VLEAYASSEGYIAAMNMSLHFKVGSVGSSPVIELEEGDDRTDPISELQIRVPPDQPNGGTCERPLWSVYMLVLFNSRSGLVHGIGALLSHAEVCASYARVRFMRSSQRFIRCLRL